MLLSPEQIDKLKKIEGTDVFIKAIANASEIFGIELKKIVRTNSEGETKVHIDRTIAVDKFINGVVQETLNNMEFFAMHFTHNTAEESVVYQSLHKTYIDMVRALYYNISRCNKLGETYFYTNVIALYNKWND